MGRGMLCFVDFLFVHHAMGHFVIVSIEESVNQIMISLFSSVLNTYDAALQSRYQSQS